MARKQQHFPFLDLPKELRLMVYKLLPVKTSHAPFGTSAPQSLILVWSSFPSISILQACRQVNEEATAVLHQRLNQLKTQPLRIVAASDGLHEWRLTGLIRYLNRRRLNDLVFVGPYPQQLDAEARRCISEEDEARVNIAVLGYSATPSDGNTDMLMVIAFGISVQIIETDLKALAHRVKVSLQPAIWTPGELAALKNSRLAPISTVQENRSLSVEVIKDAEIGEAEWAENWTEGECINERGYHKSGIDVWRT
ncbi:hypothetical protein EK21DRAFT_92098 [Setomelanomma holmii]|uniref:Uncharacterized protein n=1 Tax=Setomelanomma holmii TaxID=210430 RepID=A0A9P4H359_9PLEO|nr:hypothetical protein EK21DRAFT_92098 [Setomelanomma holmii]